MPIIGNFPSGAGGGGGLTLAEATDIQTITAHNKVYIKWTDPEDLVVAGSNLATWSGTVLVRKAGSKPLSRRDGVLVLDSKKRNAYQNKYFADGNVTDGTEYFYKLFPYTTAGAYTDNEKDEFAVTPESVAPGNVTSISAVASGNGKVTLKWTDPDDTVTDGITVSAWAGTRVVYKQGGAPASANDGMAVTTSITKNQYATSGFVVDRLENGVTYHFGMFPYATEETGGLANNDAANTTTGVPNRLVIADEPKQKGALTYNGTDNTNGTAQTPLWDNYDETKMTLDAAGQSAAGTYEAKFTPKDDYCWAGGSLDAKTISWSIGKKGIEKVTASGTTFTYNKGEQAPVWTNYDSGTITIGGDSGKKVDAGNYTTTFTPMSNFQWNTGDSDAVSVQWEINRADLPRPTLDKSAITLSGDQISDTFTVTREGDGAVTATADSGTVVTTSVAETTVTVTSVDKTTGKATITVKVEQGTNYNAYVNTDVTVSVDAKFLPVVGTPLDNCSWDDINNIAAAGLAEVTLLLATGRLFRSMAP